MRPICTIPVVATVLLTGLSFSFNGNKKSGEKIIAEKAFAVVELFTSEGCSSCPPADELAIKLSKEYTANVYFLSYHVDYWNYLGWKDKYSKADFTTRQRQYTAAFNLNSIYTPQAVVNGKKEFVGSDQNRLKKAIMEELKEKSSIDLSVIAKSNNDSISVSYKTEVSDKWLLNIALVQLHAETPVKRGENTGHYLKHINVVRDLQTITIDQKAENIIKFKIPDGLLSNEMKVVAFMHDKTNLKILSVSEAIIQ